MKVAQEEIRVKGKPIKVASVRINNCTVITSGTFSKIAKVNEEWFIDIEDPQSFIKNLTESKIKADIFTFWQRLPETKPKYAYYMEWDNYAALPITSYNDWFDNQIDRNSKRAVNRAKNNGVDVRIADANDELVNGIMSIFNETPIRQGKKFWHYGKDFNTIKKEILLSDLDSSEFIGAYYNHNLIGFAKLIYTKEYASFVQILSKMEYRTISPTNALIAKAVEICSSRKIPYLVYGNFDYGKMETDTLSDFKRRNGFKKINVPRYYVPLTVKGIFILSLRFHRGIKGIIPKQLKEYLTIFRKKWHLRKSWIKP